MAAETRPAIPGKIVIVVGPGRSGTSSFAGALQRLGFHVPEPQVVPDETNPAGFYEPQWAVDFHTRMLKRAVVRTIDASPYAGERAARTGAKPGVRAKLRAWLGDVLENQATQVVIKDPRTAWFVRLWVETAREFGIEPGFVTMLRHPAEVSSSRRVYYGKDRSDDAERRADDIARIGGWINVALNAERESRGSMRAFVRYTDLMADWRSTMTAVENTLGLTFDPPPALESHPVDEFIDPTLRRIRGDWSGLDVPDGLRELAERTWDALCRLATEGRDSPEALAEVDTVAADYASFYADASALNRSELWRGRIDARRRTETADRARV